MGRFIFFHWVDCPQSRSSSAIRVLFKTIRTIQQSDKTFFHTDISSKWLEKNYSNEQSTKLNLDYVDKKQKHFHYQTISFQIQFH